MNTWIPSKVPSKQVKDTAGMGGDKMMVDIDAFLDDSKPGVTDNATTTTTTDTTAPSPQKTGNTASSNQGGTADKDRHESVDLGAFLNDLKGNNDPTSIMKGGGAGAAGKKSITQRHPRVSIAGVTDVQEAPKHSHHHHKSKGRKREPVTENQAKEALRHMKELRENQGLNGLLTFLQKNAGVGPNDEMAAVCCDFIVAEILVLDRVEPKRENEHIEEIHDLGMDPFEEGGGYRPELLKRDHAISQNVQFSILKVLDKDVEPEHALSFTRLFALLTIELSQTTQKVKLLSKSKSMDSRVRSSSMSFEPGTGGGMGPPRSGMAKLQNWLSVDGGGLGEEVLSAVIAVMAAQSENSDVVAYCMMILSACSGVLGGRRQEYMTKHGFAQTVCDTLVFQSTNWMCAMYGMRALLGGCDKGAGWVSTIAAANGIIEVLEALRRHVDRPSVAEPALRLILYIVTGHDSDTERRRNAFVDADGVIILVKVMHAMDMYTQAHKFFHPELFNDNLTDKLSSAKVLKEQNELRLKAHIFKEILSSIELVVGGSTKLADERRIKLIGSLCDEICDMVSSQPNEPQVQEAGFRVLSAYCESTKKGVAEAFIDDVNSAGGSKLACDALYNKKLRKSPGTISAILKMIANMCRDQSQSAETCRGSFMNGKVAKACANILQSSMVAEAGDPLAEALALSGIKVIHHLAAGLLPSDRTQVLRSGGPAAVTAVLTVHTDRPQIVTAGADALRVMTLNTWKPPPKTNIKQPTLRDQVLGFHYGTSSSKLGRELIVEAKAHLVICAALGRKQVVDASSSSGDGKTLDEEESENGGGGGAASKKTKGLSLASRQKRGGGGGGGAGSSGAGPDVNPAVVQMVSACARFLGTLAMDSGSAADLARDALMAVNAHKLICVAMKPSGELKQAARAMAGCIEALRHFAGSGENSTSLLRREVMSRGGDEMICSAMRAHPTDLEIQRAACCALRNLSFGGREEGDQRRTRLIKIEAHTRAATALRLFLSVESEPARMIEATALHLGAVGLIRNLSFGGGKEAEMRRAALFKVKAEELVLGTITVTAKAISESLKRGGIAPLDLVECLEVCMICMGNLLSGNGWQVENRRYEAAISKKVYEPVLETMASYPKLPTMQFSCLVCLSNICMGSGHGADLVRALVVEHELPKDYGNDSDAIRMCCKAMRRFMKDLMVAQAGIIFLANLCTATSSDANEIRAIILAEGGHELVLYAMEYFPRKGEEAGNMITAAGVAFLQNLTAGEGAHRPRQLLLSEGHLDFLPVLADIMDVSIGDQVITGHAIGLLGNLCIGWDENDGDHHELPGAEARRQMIMGVDGVQLIANVLRAYRGSGAIMKGAFKAVAALCEGRNPASDKRRDECMKLRIHVLICETLKNPNILALHDEDILEGGRLALGCIMYDSKGKSDRRKAVMIVMSDYELKMHTQFCICLRRGAKEYQPFAADNRFNVNDEGDVFEEEGMNSTLKSHKWSKLDKVIENEGEGDEDDEEGEGEDFTTGRNARGGGGGGGKSEDKSWSNLHRRLSMKKDKMKTPSSRSSMSLNKGPSATIGDDDDEDEDARKSMGGRKSSFGRSSRNSTDKLSRAESMGASENFKAMQDMGDDIGAGDRNSYRERDASRSGRWSIGGLVRQTSVSARDFTSVLSGNSNDNFAGSPRAGGGGRRSSAFSMPTMFVSKAQADAMLAKVNNAPPPERSSSVMFVDKDEQEEEERRYRAEQLAKEEAKAAAAAMNTADNAPTNVLDIEAIIAEHAGPSGTIGGDEGVRDGEEGGDDFDNRRSSRRSSSGRRRSRSRSKSRKSSSNRRSSTRTSSSFDLYGDEAEEGGGGDSGKRRESSSGSRRKSSRKSSSRKSRSSRESREESNVFGEYEDYGDYGGDKSSSSKKHRESKSGSRRSKSRSGSKTKSIGVDDGKDDDGWRVSSTAEGGFDEKDLGLSFDDQASLSKGGESGEGGGSSRPKISSAFSFFRKSNKSLDAEEAAGIIGAAPLSATIGEDEEDDVEEGERSRRKSKSSRKSKVDAGGSSSRRASSTSMRESGDRGSSSYKLQGEEGGELSKEEGRKRSKSNSKRRSSTGSASMAQVQEGDLLGLSPEDDAAMEAKFLQRKSSRRGSTGEAYTRSSKLEGTEFGLEDVEGLDGKPNASASRPRGSSVPFNLSSKSSTRQDSQGSFGGLFTNEKSSSRKSSTRASEGGGKLLSRLSGTKTSGPRSSSRFVESVSFGGGGLEATIGGDDEDEQGEVNALLAGMVAIDEDGPSTRNMPLEEEGLKDLFKKQRSSRAGKM